MGLIKIRMKEKLRVAVSAGGNVLAQVGDEIEVQDFIADGLVDQGIAVYVREGGMQRTAVEPELEAKAEEAAPENKDESKPPKNKREGWEEDGKKIRVHALAKQLGVHSRDILIEAAKLGFGATSPASSLTDNEAHEIIKSIGD